MILDLITQYGISNQNHHIIWLNNLFTSIRLFIELIAEGFGAAGTVRTTKTEREVREANSGTAEQKK